MQRGRPASIGSSGRFGAGRTTIITDLIDGLRGDGLAVPALE